MFPLSFLVGLFICVAIPASYYFIRTQDIKKEAGVHAEYLASIFKEVVETTPETWEEGIRSYISRTNISFVKIYDRNRSLVSEIYAPSFSPKTSFITEEKAAYYAGKVYAFVVVGISLATTKAEALRLLFYSGVSGTFIGILLFLLPVLEINRVEEQVNESRKQLLDEQEKLKLSEEKYRALFEFAPDGIVISTKDGKIVSYNQSFLNIFGLSERDIEKLNMKELYLQSTIRDEIMKELHKKGYVQNREVFLKKGNEQMPALISLKLIRCQALSSEICTDNPEQMLVENIIRDISVQKKMEQQLIQAQKMESIGVLAGGVAHDFNNLLAGVLGYAELIKAHIDSISGGEDKENPIYRYAEMIEKSANRASDLTQKLLAFARRSEFQVESVNLNEIIEEVVDILSRTIEKTIIIKKELEPNLDLVEADPSQMNQALLNICINARDAMPNGGILKIKTFNTHLERKFFITGDTSRPGNYVAVEISDTGLGIDKSIIHRIFEPFFTTKGKTKGTGLGLSMVYGIVRKHGGYIDVKSELGHGSVFTIYLPVCEGKTRQRKEEICKKADLDKGRGRILVVDDEEIVRELAKEILTQRGYEVILAEDGIEGISLYQRNKIDLVILDMVMPKKTGQEVFEELKKIDPDVRVVIATGYSIEQQAQEMLSKGALGLVKKPYQIEELLTIVKKALQTGITP